MVGAADEGEEIQAENRVPAGIAPCGLAAVLADGGFETRMLGPFSGGEGDEVGEDGEADEGQGVRHGEFDR